MYFGVNMKKFLLSILAAVSLCTVSVANELEAPKLEKPAFIQEVVVATPWAPSSIDDPFSVGQTYSMSGKNYSLLSYSLLRWDNIVNRDNVVIYLDFTLSAGQDVDTFKPVFGPGAWVTLDTKSFFMAGGVILIFQDDQIPDGTLGFMVGTKF